MAFAYTRDKTSVVGSLRISTGTFTNAAADSGGAITTGLKQVAFFSAQCNSHLGTETIKQTISGGTATVVTSDGADGVWFAVGRP